MDVYMKLSVNDRVAFYINLTSQMESDTDDRIALLEEVWQDQGGHCPHCESERIVKNGHRKDGTQRYLCRECRHSFLAGTGSVLSGTHKHLSVWKQYLNCMMGQKTLRESSEECGISMGTAFHWRHKILDSLQPVADQVCIGGVVEADETYTAVSYKGNHSNSKTFAMPRAAHKRGHDTHMSGLSFEQICIPCAVDRSGVPVTGIGKCGKVSTDCIERVLAAHLHPDTVICTDREQAYLRFVKDHGLSLVRMDRDRRTKGSYGIQRINAYHSRLQGFLRRRNGVSAKYLGNYLLWHRLMFGSVRKGRELQEILLAAAVREPYHIRCRDLSSRPPIPV